MNSSELEPLKHTLMCVDVNIGRCFVQLSKIMHSGLTARNLPEKVHNFPLTKVKYSSVVGKAEEQSFIKGTQVQRTRHRSFALLCYAATCRDVLHIRPYVTLSFVVHGENVQSPLHKKP